jgi:hypothetical protein
MTFLRSKSIEVLVFYAIFSFEITVFYVCGVIIDLALFRNLTTIKREKKTSTLIHKSCSSLIQRKKKYSAIKRASLRGILWFQITSACSDQDNAWWKRNFAAVFDSGKTIQHLSVKDSRILTEKQVKYVMRL